MDACVSPIYIYTYICSYEATYTPLHKWYIASIPPKAYLETPSTFSVAPNRQNPTVDVPAILQVHPPHSIPKPCLKFRVFTLQWLASGCFLLERNAKRGSTICYRIASKWCFFPVGSRFKPAQQGNPAEKNKQTNFNKHTRMHMHDPTGTHAPTHTRTRTHSEAPLCAIRRRHPPSGLASTIPAKGFRLGIRRAQTRRRGGRGRMEALGKGGLP